MIDKLSNTIHLSLIRRHLIKHYFWRIKAPLKVSALDLNPQQLHLEQWREVFHKRATQPNPDSKRTAFDRARRDLQSKGWLTVEDDVYTLTPRTPGQSPDKQD